MSDDQDLRTNARLWLRAQRRSLRSSLGAVAGALWCIGLALTAQPAVADAPIGRYAVRTDNVLDQRTQLTWQRAVPAGTYTMAQASAYCASLSLAGSNWRLPTIGELMSIVDVTRFDPSIDGGAFPSTPSLDFWTSSLYTGSTTMAWSINFYHGTSNIRATSSAYRVRCVR